MSIILLDSSVIFDHFNGRNGRSEFLAQLIDQGHVLACCSVNITEVYAGLRAGEEQGTPSFRCPRDKAPFQPATSAEIGSHSPSEDKFWDMSGWH